MGELILCKGPVAANSYYLEDAAINIYSQEELCYYIYNNAYAIPDDFVDESLCVWIRDELGFDSLGTELLELLNNGAGLNVLVSHLLKSCGYLTKSEIKKSLEIIASFEGMSEAEAGKLRADHMVRAGRYLDAVFLYESMLDKKVPMEDELKSKLLHNLGSAYCGLFFFKKAEYYFESAYRLGKDPESVAMLLYACLFSRDKESFDMYVDRYQILPEEENRIKSTYEEHINGSESKDFYDNMISRVSNARDDVEKEFIFRDIIDDFKKDYRSLRG